MKKKDSTEVLRVRQSVGENKLALIVCAVLALASLIGWLNYL